MRSAWLEIDLNAYRGNLEALRRHAGRPVLAVVKANAYGHGLALMARAALDGGCPGVAVALPEEGAELRAAGVRGRIVILGLGWEEQAELIAAERLEPVVTRREMLRALSDSGRRQGMPVAVHVKVDTGMTRVGLPPEAALDFCREVAADPHLRLAGVMTHFASADADTQEFTQAQWARFQPLVAELSVWTPRPLLHACNSAAALWFPDARLDWIRGGLVTYGVPPAPRELPISVSPVLSLHARVMQLRDVPAGCSVSYGGAWTAPHASRLALVPVGYADGLPWALSNRGEALIRGCRVPIRGRVCMDQVVLDVTDVPGVGIGEEAVFIGRQGAEEITVPEIAALAGTISYEVLTGMAARLPRVPVG